MQLETHLTAACPPPAIGAFSAWLVARAMKLTTIELSHGVSPHQPMITTWDRARRHHRARALPRAPRQGEARRGRTCRPRGAGLDPSGPSLAEPTPPNR